VYRLHNLLVSLQANLPVCRPLSRLLCQVRNRPCSLPCSPVHNLLGNQRVSRPCSRQCSLLQYRLRSLRTSLLASRLHYRPVSLVPCPVRSQRRPLAPSLQDSRPRNRPDSHLDSHRCSLARYPQCSRARTPPASPALNPAVSQRLVRPPNHPFSLLVNHR
jgi:hypothetical protein